MFNLGKKIVVYAATSGELKQLNQVSDEVFAKKMMGDGYAIEPNQNSVFSPIDGKIAFVFPTKHAIGIVHDSGTEILIHVGINTVELKGENFESIVSEGDIVKVGQEILRFDRDQIKGKGYQITTMVIVTNTPEFDFIFEKPNRIVQIGDTILKLQRK